MFPKVKEARMLFSPKEKGFKAPVTVESDDGSWLSIVRGIADFHFMS